MTLKRVFFLLLAIGLICGVGAGIFVLSAYGEEGANFKHRLLDFFFYPAYVLLSVYSLLLVTKWLAKASIGLNLPRLGEIQIVIIGNGARCFFYVIYLSLGSVLALITGYESGVIGVTFYGRIFL